MRIGGRLRNSQHGRAPSPHRPQPNSGVTGCDITDTGSGGVALEGGDRKTLTPAGLYAENNHIYHYSRWSRMYQPGVACGASETAPRTT